jgi:hypothetical protein
VCPTSGILYGSNLKCTPVLFPQPTTLRWRNPNPACSSRTDCTCPAPTVPPVRAPYCPLPL